MASVVSVPPAEMAHKIARAMVAGASAPIQPAARPCLALVPAGFFPRVPPPPVRVSAMTYWTSRTGDLTYITRHLKAGRAVAAQCGTTWCILASSSIGRKMSGIIARAGFPHRVELRTDRAGTHTLLFIPEEK
jgi:hypothetical protein